ncbi:MAG: M15 family metallopeptidase [Lachnospiraceae bacterium]|nr:M15 family metallopeptidase [Lachnospiraceae bacterium]
MNSKYHFFRKTAAVVLTLLAFVSSASFSNDATAGAIGSDVVIVNENGKKITVAKSDIVKEDESGNNIEDEALLIEDEKLDQIASESKKAAEDFNKRNGAADTSSDMLIEDENGNLLNPSFEGDWSLILINKDHLIPDDYTFELATITDSVTADVRCAGALVDMIKDAKHEGVYLYVLSPYRDLERQTYVFNRKVDALMAEGHGYDEAYKLAAEVVAPPGTSEHQIGLAFDFVTDGYWKLDQGFAYTEGGKWLAEHAREYGFILRYPKGKEDITTIEFEPWHYRYVGVKAAKEIERLGLTLEEYDEMIGLVE